MSVKDPQMMLVPMVIEQTETGRTRVRHLLPAAAGQHHLYRALRLTTISPIWSIAQMLFLAQEDPEKDIQLYINSPGGSITAGWRFTTPCSSCEERCDDDSASDRQPAWQRFLLCAGTKEAVCAAELTNPDPSAIDGRAYRTGDGY